MSWPLAQGNALPSAVRFVTRSFPVSFSRPNSIASGEEPPERLYRHKPSVGVERGERGLSRPHLEFWGNSVYVDCDGNTFSPCALGPEEAPVAAANPVHRLLGHRDGGPRPPSHDRHHRGGH